MIEHHVPLVVDVCDYVYVLNFGQVLTEGVPAQVQTHPEVIAAYLGGEAPEHADVDEQEPADAAS
jgi:branched-chain amino acid transport system ATP-binding protein